MKRKSVSQQAEVVKVKTRAWEELTPEEQKRVNAKIARLTREAIEASRPSWEAAWLSAAEEDRKWEAWLVWFDNLPRWKRILARFGLVRPPVE